MKTKDTTLLEQFQNLIEKNAETEAIPRGFPSNHIHDCSLS
jgi:hypothetical protein